MTKGQLGSHAPVLLLAVLALLASVPGDAQSPAPAPSPSCPPVKKGEELRPIPVLAAKNGLLSTTFRVETRTSCVPALDSSGKPVNKRMTLRTYVYPSPTQPGQWSWGHPGPTLRLRKASAPGGKGDGLAIRLVNNLPPDGGGTCDSACAAGTQCPTDPSKLPDPTQCGTSKDPLCCCWVNVQQKYPDCFHGDNTTNLHFHGTHVSPQAPQDYVLLELRPRLRGKVTPAAVQAMHAHGAVAFGEYNYKVDPLPYNQAEGTHWYHPHKHGSVALQVGNGLPGAMIIEGPFDDWLRGYYGGKLVEKVIVLQQVQQNTNLFEPGSAAPFLLANGQLSPKITMKPGEVQRWRFVNATMQNAAQVLVDFADEVAVKQIAMDGVQFAPENYDGQPLIVPNNPGAFQLSPGNRADLLVQAPTTTGTFQVTHLVFSQPAERTRERLRQRDEALAPGPPIAPVISVVVAPGTRLALGAPSAFPPVSQWPKMPNFLRDVAPDEIKLKPNLTFQMSAGPGNPATKFFINDVQYDASCVNVTSTLDTAAEWTIQNSSPLQHPFHIHTNPFQLVTNGATQYKAPYVWFDTIALPAGSVATPGSVLMRQRYLDFTGEYVLHCHFLGHEDRGMMWNVQTVCPNDTKAFGKARADGKPECLPENFIPASPQCMVPVTRTGTAP